MGAQGRTYEPGGVKDESADAIREFNEFVRRDARVDVVVLPFRDGVSIVTRRRAPRQDCASKNALLYAQYGKHACTWRT